MSLYTRIKEQWMATPEELERGNKPRPFWPLKKKDKVAESVENLKATLETVEEEITVAREGDNMTLLLKLQNKSKRLKQKLSELEPISPPSEKSPQAEEEIPTPKEPVKATVATRSQTEVVAEEVKEQLAPTVPSPSKTTLEDLERQRDAAKSLRERALRRKNMEESAVIYDAMVRKLDEEIKIMKGGD